MNSKHYRYDAFISYRHLPEDMAAAVCLQQLLERHKGKDGKHLRVFRDQSELPTSGDLGGDIQEALEQSRYFIVIASPSYQESKWCMAELNHFRAIHGNTNDCILPLLLSGEPADVFPEVLRWENQPVTDPDGALRLVRQEVEPLGADIRAESIQKQRKRLKTEYLRIAAPILGCGFDDLYQRAQRQRRNQILGIAAGVAALAVAFSIYSLFMLNQIQTRQTLLEAKQQELEAKQEELYANESRRLGNEAMAILEDNPDLAMLLSDTALPENLSTPEYPIQQEAALAIRSTALDAKIQQQSHGIRLIATVAFEAISQTYNGGFLGFYDEGRCFAMYDTNHIWLLDAATGQVKTALEGWEDITLSSDAATYVKLERAIEDGNHLLYAHLYDTYSSQLLGSAKVLESTQYTTSFCQYEEGKFYLLHQNGDGFTAYGHFTLDGQYTKSSQLPKAPKNTSNFFMQQPVEEFALVLEDPQIRANFEARFSPTYTVDTIYTTYDGRLYFVHISNDQGSTVVLWAAEEEQFLGFSQGTCFQSGDNRLFYSLDDYELRIYAYYPEYFSQALYQETEYDCISSDGSRVAIYQLPTLYLYNTDDLSTPVFSAACNKYRLTRDMEYVILRTQENVLQVYQVDTGKLLWETEATVSYYWGLGISEDGSRIAVADGNTYRIDVYDLDTGEKTHSLQPESRGCLYYLEFMGDRLAASSDYESYIFDLTGKNEPVTIEHAYTFATGFIDDFPLAGGWDEEAGILAVPGIESSAYGDRWRPCAILDVDAGNSLSFRNRYDTGKEGFCYDPVSHTLFDQETNEIIALRKGENGDFQEVYRITARDTSIALYPFRQCCDGKYLVLNGSSQTEIYDVSDGTLLFVLPHGYFHTPCYGIIDGVLYDLNGGGDVLASYALPDVETARAWVREYLAEAGSRRTFSQEETEIYYIPDEWT